MGRQTTFRKPGGGFLNNVDGVISDYQWTDEFNGKPFVAGKDAKSGKERFHSLYMALYARVDGADEDVTTTLFAGSADDFEISDDGHTLTPNNDGYQLGGDIAATRFIASWEEASQGGASSDDEDVINFEPIIGSRVRFTQRKNVEDTKKLGKRKGKDGKEYDRQDLVVTEVYETAKASTKGKATAKPAGKSAKAAKPVEVDIKELAGQTLVAIVKAAGGTIAKAKVNLKVLVTPVLKETPDQRKPVQEFLLSDDNLDELDTEGVIVWDAKAKTISAVAAE